MQSKDAPKTLNVISYEQQVPYSAQEVYDMIDEVRVVETPGEANELLKNGWTLLGVNTTAHWEQARGSFVLGWQRQ